MQQFVERRRPLLVRTDLLMRAKLACESAPDVDVRLRNLSAAGFMAECLEPIAPGTTIVLAVPGVGRFPAEIRWNEDFRIGGIFHYELAASELGLIAGASDGEPLGEADEGKSEAA